MSSRRIYTKFNWECIFDLLLKAHWENYPPALISKLTGYPIDINGKRAKKLGLPRNARHLWSKPMEKLLEDNYLTHTNSELADLLNEKYPLPDGKIWEARNHVSNQLKELGLRRPEALVKKMRSDMSYAMWEAGIYDNVQYPQAKKIGTKVMRTMKGKPWALYIKTEEGWVMYKEYLWEQAYGPVPKGYRVALADHNAENVRLDNLVLIRICEPAQNSMRALTDDYIIGILLSKKNPETIPDKKMLVEGLKEYGRSMIEKKRTELLANRSLHAKKNNKLEGGA